MQIYALYSQHTGKVEATGKTLKEAYRNLPQERANDSFQIVSPDQIQKHLDKEVNGKKEGFGVRNWYDPEKSEAAKKENINIPLKIY